MIDQRPKNRRARRLANRGRKRTILAALSSAAIALLSGPLSSTANTPIEKPAIGYSYSYYKEDPIAKSKVAFGSKSRYKIKTHQVSVEMPINERADIGTDFIYESMSGATPWYVTRDENTGKPLQAMSGATVSEKRFDATLKSNYYFDSARTGAHVGVSKERDYLAVYAGVNGEYSLNEKNTTLSGGLGFSIDKIKPTGGGANGRINSDDKQSLSMNAGISQIINRRSTVQTSLSYKLGKGFLSDPYKRALIDPVLGITVSDKRPDERHQVSWLTQYRYHFESANASLHADYRFHYDDWKVNSHTFSAKWVQNLLSDYIQIIPSLRYYSQSQAYFYKPFYSSLRNDELASSDYRLSPYGSLTLGMRMQLRIEDLPWEWDWRLGVNYERHLSDAKWALAKVSTKNPGLVDYHFVYGTLDVRF
ncbi:MAG: hypothetical protein ACI8W3_000062 [Myxococcota bacterium]|jgi:hypothetical protein